MANAFDLIVLGSGPGGYVAAIRAAQLGLKVAVVERERLGGVCLNWGCIPTKALLRSSEVYHLMRHADDFGLSADNVAFSLAKVVGRSRKVADQLNAGVKGLMTKNKITVVEGIGALTAPGELEVRRGETVERLTAKDIIVATGARARELPFATADGDRIWSYRHAMTPSEMPTKLLIIGSGAIGLEFASFYADMGAEVIVVEMLERILPVEDEEVSAFMTKALKKRGLKILTGAGVERLERTDGGGVEADVRMADGALTTSLFSHAIVAVGIAPNTDNIGLEAIGVAMERGHILTDGFGRTNVPGAWAIGDVAGAPWLAHKASHEGVVAAEAIAGVEGVHPMDKSNIPGCTYTRPQIASVGLTEAAAASTGRLLKIGKFPFTANGKAIALGEAEGFIKTIFDAETGQLLGAHMIGAEVTELIHSFVVARRMESTEEELMQTVFAHPTLSEMMYESVLAAFGRALHI